MGTTKRQQLEPVSAGEPARREAVLPFLGKQAMARKSGMEFAQNLSEKSWEQIGTNLSGLTNSSAWWLGDWLIFGETAYGWRRYREAIDRTGLDYQTLRNYAWVARRFEQHRRRDGLSFAHHAEVTRLSSTEQDYWLRKAEQQMWSRNELRRSLRASLAEQSDETDEPASGDGRREAGTPAGSAGTGKRARKVTTLTIELPAHELDCYSKAAAANGLSVDEWATRVLAAAERRTA